MRRTSLLIIASALAASQAYAQGPDVQVIQAALDNPRASCSELLQLWRSMDQGHDQENGDAPSPFRASLRRRLEDRIVRQKCVPKVHGGGAKFHPRTDDERYADYMAQVAEIERRREQCKTLSECPDLAERELELSRQAADLLCRLPRDSEKAIELKKSLGVAFGAGLSEGALLNLLQTRSLNEQDVQKLFELVLSRTSDPVGTATRLLRSLRDASVSEEETQQVIEEYLRLRAARGPKALEALQNAEIIVSLRDPAKREMLKQALDLIERRYPQMSAEVRRAKADLAQTDATRGLTDKDFVVRFFAMLDPALLAQVQKDVRLADTQVQEPPEETAPSMLPSPVLVAYGPGLKPGADACRPGDEFVHKFIESLHYRGGPSSGLLPPVEVENATGLKAKIPGILDPASWQNDRRPRECSDFIDACVRNGPTTACTREMAPYARLCTRPFAGVFLLEMDASDAAKVEPGTVKVTGTWWENVRDPSRQNAGSSWTTGSIVATTFQGCDTVQEDQAGFRVASEVARHVSLFKSGPCLQPEDTCYRDAAFEKGVRSSGWYAGAFSGMPYMLDPRATTVARIVPSALDGLLLAGTAVSGGLALKYRNDYAENRVGSLQPANRAVTATYLFAGGVLLTRLVSGLLYELAPDVWMKKGSRAARSDAIFVSPGLTF